MIKTIRQFFTCSTCELRESDGGCEHKRIFCLNKNKNYFCSDWTKKKTIPKIYGYIVKVLSKFNYYSY